MNRCLHGMVIVLPTPINADGKVQVLAARRLVRYALEAGAQGLWVLGTTGEMALLPDKERDKMLTCVLEEAAGEVPVITGVSDHSTRRVLEKIRQAARLGAPYVHILPPYSIPTNVEEVANFYRELTGASRLPFVIYNNPGITRAGVSLELVNELAQNERVLGIKETSGDLRFFQSMYYALQDNTAFSLMQGSDQLAYLSQKIGGHGVIASLAIVVPYLFRQMLEGLISGDDHQAVSCQQQIVVIARQVYTCQGPIGAIKYLLSRMDLCPPYVISPYRVPSTAERERLDLIVKDLPVIER